MIKTSQALGCLPSWLPGVDWIPVDMLAAILIDLALFMAETGKTCIFNVVNPDPTTWESLSSTILRRLGSEVRAVELSE